MLLEDGIFHYFLTAATVASVNLNDSLGVMQSFLEFLSRVIRREVFLMWINFAKKSFGKCGVCEKEVRRIVRTT